MNKVSEQTAAREARQQAKAAKLAAAQKKKAAMAEKLAGRRAAMERRGEAVAAHPHPQAKWDAERAEEAKRLKRIKKHLDKRTRKDVEKRFMFETLPKLPDPIQQPDFSEPDPAEPAPPRDGLIPGTFKVMDQNRLGALLDADPLPPRWTARHVGVRLIEAMEVVKRLPANIYPKSYGAAWPQYRFEGVELAYQAGAGTLAMGRNTTRRAATADEVARTTEALTWPMQYLSGCNYWSLASLNKWAEAGEPDSRDAPTDLLQFIADCLNAAKEVVR